MDTAMRLLQSSYGSIDQRLAPMHRDFVIHVANLNGTEMTGRLALSSYIALVSIGTARPTIDSLAVLGEVTISGAAAKLDDLADQLQIASDSGAKNILLPVSAT
jgi:ATP-dependent Lon protease